jgi:glucose-induced degradation protein 8
LKLLDTSPGIHFALLRLQLIELIKECNASDNGDVRPAIDFATKHLAPRAPANKGFLNDLEETMLLIMHQPNSPQLTAMNDPSVRQEIAKMVNDALLEDDNMASEADIRKLIRTRAFVGQEFTRIQDTLKNSPKTPFPPFDLGTDEDEQMSS